MASFTDDLQYLTQHKPYVEQNPVQAMVEVGRFKQSQYDQGIQRINQQIENVAGIDVVRDADKNYLQSKLNELGGKLKSVAAGDFSQYQLVNSVGGMINSVAKDKGVQNAASSTAWYRKQVEKMQKDIDEGKSNPANIDYFQKHANKWLTSPVAGEKFSGSYVPNFDVFKFAKETFDAVKPDGYTFDQLYITDENGTPRTDAQGRPIASPFMKRLEKEGIFPEKVRATLNQIFNDPRVDTQLAISGEYALKGLPPQLLSNKILLQKDKIVGELTEQLNTLNLQKNTGKEVQDQIDQIQLNIDNIKSKYNDLSDLALENPDQVRASLYKDDVRNNYTSMFGWTKTKEQAMSSPLWDANFKLNQEANRVAEFRETMDFNKSKEAFDRQYKLTDLNFKFSKEAMKNKTSLDGKQDFEASNESYVMQFDNIYEGAANDYKDASNDFIYSTILKNPESDLELQEYIRAGNTKEQAVDILMKNKVRTKYLLQGVTPDETLVNNEVADMKATWESEAVSAVNKMTPGDRAKNADVQDSYNNYARAKKEFRKVQEMKDEAERRMGTELSGTLNSANFKIQPVKFNVEDKSLNLSSEDIYNAAIYLKGNELPLGFLNNKNLREQAKVAERNLRSQGKEFLIDYINDYKQTLMGNNPGLARFGAENEVIQNRQFIDEFKKLYKNIDNSALQSAIKSKAETIKNMGFTVSPSLRFDIITGNTEVDKNTFSNILTTAANYRTNKQNISPDFDYTDIEAVLNDKEAAKAVEIKTRKNDSTGEIVPEIVFYDKKGERTTGMVITPEEALSLGVDVNGIYEPVDVKLLRDRMNASPLGSTSIGDPKDVSTYIDGDVWFERQDFPMLTNSKYDVKANLFSKNGQVYPVIYVWDGLNKPKVRTLPGEKDLAGAVDKLMSVTPQFANAVLNEK